MDRYEFKLVVNRHGCQEDGQRRDFVKEGHPEKDLFFVLAKKRDRQGNPVNLEASGVQEKVRIK